MPQPKIVVVGGGFGGLAAAKTLRKASAQILLKRGSGFPEAGRPRDLPFDRLE